MDPLSLAAAATVALKPVLSWLLSRGGDVADDIEAAATEKVSRTTIEWASGLWGRLRKKAAQSSPEQEQLLIAAATDVVQDEDDSDATAALRLRIRRLLEEDVDLQREVRDWLDSAPAAGIVMGERAVNVGNMSNSAITTGDNSGIGR